MSIQLRTETPPTEVQMKLLISQVLSRSFAYNSPVIILDFEVDDNGNISGRFKDANKPRVFSFELNKDFVNFKPFSPNRMDSLEFDVQVWEQFSAGYSFRVDAVTGRKKPTCKPNVSYSCGDGCISVKKNCRKQPKTPNEKEVVKQATEKAKAYPKKSKANNKKESGKEKSKQTKKSSTSVPTRKTKEESILDKKIGDGTHEGTPKNAQEYFDMMTKKGNSITMEEAQKTIESISYWSEAGYRQIREDQKKGRYNEDADLIDNYIKNSTPYKGEIYRGINFNSEKQVMEWIKGTNGDGILNNLGCHESWSSDSKVAEDFTYSGRGQPVLIKLLENKSGVSIEGLSTVEKKESEVIVPKSTKLKVKSYRKENGKIIIETEEI